AAQRTRALGLMVYWVTAGCAGAGGGGGGVGISGLRKVLLRRKGARRNSQLAKEQLSPGTRSVRRRIFSVCAVRPKTASWDFLGRSMPELSTSSASVKPLPELLNNSNRRGCWATSHSG